MSNIIELENYPELDFIENMTLQETGDQIRELYTGYYWELTGRDPKIGDANMVNLLIKAFYAMGYQTIQCTDAKDRMGVLKTNTGSVLDALAALAELIRRVPERATAPVRFNLEEPGSAVVAIPAETQVKTEDGEYFDSLEYAEIKTGESYTDVVVQAEGARAESSGIPSGAIKILIDSIPYISGMNSTTPSTGGLDVEDDDSLTWHIYLTSSIYDCAGPRDTYKYYAREWHGDVADVHIVNPQPDEVNIYFVIEDEAGPRPSNPTELMGMAEHMDDETIRPLYSHVGCPVPEGMDYTISFTYWITESNQRNASETQGRVAAAVKDFQTWQRKLGRNISPMELIAHLRVTEAKRVKLMTPADMAVQTMMLPKCTGVTATYGRLEND